MSGRYEKEMQIEQQVMNRLCDMPSILTDYYYYLLSNGGIVYLQVVYIESS